MLIHFLNDAYTWCNISWNIWWDTDNVIFYQDKTELMMIYLISFFNILYSAYDRKVCPDHFLAIVWQCEEALVSHCCKVSSSWLQYLPQLQICHRVMCSGKFLEPCSMLKYGKWSSSCSSFFLLPSGWLIHLSALAEGPCKPPAEVKWINVVTASLVLMFPMKAKERESEEESALEASAYPL